ncbi:hypothetical protein [Homoserinimonas hongtaonis]|uniref:Uncharacterized protein n=1 Tax=Homoserinimonas hongtaonis TaxID=2079791 RepID=A0A2U1SXJ2_9MICO|nr:hypothetical protein [Salinibacterium hongtaonis]PWB96263.1 hypothetical protein DF220_12955 [Salinibacterium hongtaonis]
MERWAPQKNDVLGALADEILHNYARGRGVIGVDGRHNSGTAEFADDLAAMFLVQGRIVERTSLDGYTSVAAGVLTVDGEGFRREVVTPFRAQPGDAMLIVDGTGAHLPAVRGSWNFSIWLDSDADAEAKNHDAAGSSAEPGADTDARTAEAEYVYAEDPSRLATAIYNNRDPKHPRRVFADSC